MSDRDSDDDGADYSGRYEEDDEDSNYKRHGEKADMVEGGDYHLKSALKCEADLEMDHVYLKEKNAMMAELGDLGDLIYPHSVFQFIEKISHMWSTDRASGLSRWVTVNPDSRLDMSNTKRLLGAEISLVCPDVNPTDVGGWLTSGYDAFAARFSHLEHTMKILLILLPILNNIKNLRNGMGVDNAINEYITINSGLVSVDMNSVSVVRMNTDIVVFDCPDERYYLPKDYFLNMCDKLQERVNIYLYTEVCSQTWVPLAPKIELVSRVIAWGDEVLKKLGNDGYRVIGIYEATLVGIILNRDDPSLITNPDRPGFLEALKEDLGGVEIRFIDQLVNMLSTVDVRTIIDLHGLYRIWGHPIIDIDGGVKKLQKVTQEKKEVDPDSEESINARRSFRKIFCKNYFKKNGFYPPLKLIDRTTPCYLSRCLLEGVEVMENHMDYKFQQWDNVALQKAFSIPYSWNIVHLAKDKSISPTRSELYSLLSKTGNIFSANLRRGILKLLDSKLIPLRDFLTKVAAEGLHVDDCIIGLFPKEREIKILARFFSLMSFNMRLYFTSTESLLGDKVLKYFPQITMNLNLLDMQEKMSSMSKSLKEQSDSVTYVVNMDFVKWNQQMREEICRSVFAELDAIFGLPGLYTRSHQIFKQSILYLADGTRELHSDPHTGVHVDGKYCWRDDGAGKEGIRQKAWTIMTVCDIETVAQGHTGQFQLVGGGDNQVLTVTYKTNNIDGQGDITEEGKAKIKRKMENFLADLERHFQRRGLPLKTSETWCSTSLFMYNKHIYYKGAATRAPLKQVSRMFPYSNNTSMSISSMSQCLGTTLRSICQKDYVPFPALFMRNYWAQLLCWIISYCHPMMMSISKNIKQGVGGICRRGRRLEVPVEGSCSKHLMLRLAYLPGHFGGPGMINIYQAMMRGFPDPITEGICFLRNMTQALKRRDDILYSFFRDLSGVSFSLSRSMEPLIEDVTSLNNDAPRTGASEHREAAKEILTKSKLGKNLELKSLISIMSGDLETQFYRSLASGPSLDVKVLHEIASATLYSITNTLTSRIDKTSTLSRLTHKISLLKKMALAEESYLKYLMIRDSRKHDLSFDACSRVLADKARSTSWRKQIIGVTVPTPFEYLVCKSGQDHVCNGDAIIARVDEVDRTEMMTELGPCKVYLGTYTREKFKMTEIAAAYGEEDILAKSIQLMKLINWRYPEGSQMAEILKCPLRAVTDLNPELLIQNEVLTKGDYDHRRKLDSRVHGGIPNFVTTSTSHTSLCTSTWVSHARGGKNENIHFQACLISSQFRILCMRYWGILTSRVLHFHESCQTCIQALEQPAPGTTTPSIIPAFPTLRANRLVFVPSQEVEFDFEDQERVTRAQFLGLVDCEKKNVYDWADLYSSLAWTIICNMLGITSMSPSFYLIMRDNVNHHCLGLYLAMFWRCLRKLGALESTPNINWSPMIYTFSCEEGMRVLQEEMGLVITGSVEGGFVMGTGDSCDTLDLLLIDEMPPMTCNIFCPMIKWQVCVWWYSQSSFVSGCILCMRNIKSMWMSSNMLHRVDEDLRCSSHMTNEMKPVMINAHIENLRQYGKYSTEEPHTDIDTVCLPISKDLVEEEVGMIRRMISLPSEYPDEGSVPPVIRYGGDVDNVTLFRMILESLSLLNPVHIVLGPDINMLRNVVAGCSLTSLEMEIDTLMIDIVISALSYQESDTFYELKAVVPKRMSRRIRFCMNAPQEGFCRFFIKPDRKLLKYLIAGDWVLCDCHELIEMNNTLKPDEVYYLPCTPLRWLLLVKCGTGVFGPGDLIETLSKPHYEPRFWKIDHCIISAFSCGKLSGGGFTELRRKLSWSLFSNKYELLTICHRVTNQMNRSKAYGGLKQWSRNYREGIIVFILSVLMRSENHDLHLITTLSYAEMDLTHLTITPKFNKAGVVSIRYLPYIWFFKRYYDTKRCHVDIEFATAIKSMNLGSPRGSGLNIIML
ncbi:MAG: RNA-dependent RNA polymerase [Artemisia capillaris nucleorhabdovirus 1]|uniref:RNA-directed RNA polymerase n=1 Tax=Artemisia capillaris nucleorhabdovirus 1 TaxID=2912606 RepID=A0AAX2ZMQ2_9RHAB|nr:MAG: RNA-dependent RNA polymerase [Artemisia capillaris nucleorhabdovirus 1]UKL15221.1 MAG: RNA-dependent RNA polymerase [Artemisia capillaris nucleorhabdovirus 1]